MAAPEAGRCVCLVTVTVLLLFPLLPLVPSMGVPTPEGGMVRPAAEVPFINETGDGSRSFADAIELGSGDRYLGRLDRVGDRADYFRVLAAQHQVVNVHVRVLGHDGTDEWRTPTVTDPPSPPPPSYPACALGIYLLHAPGSLYPLDGAYGYYYVRDYVVNACAPVPGTHAYYVNVSIDWYMTPNNFTWDYMLELDVGPVTELEASAVVTGTLDMAANDTAWYRVRAPADHELNGSIEMLDFDPQNPERRNIDIWVFPDDLGGYPRAMAWDWAAAPNRPVEPFSILTTYEGHYYIKVRGMDHKYNQPTGYRLEVHVTPVPEFPEGGVMGAHLDRVRDDTDWYRFTMRANQPHPAKPGLWNEVAYFNMTERADSEDLPDFDLYLFGRVPGTRVLDTLDSSIRNDHYDFFDPNRDPHKNTEHVRAAAVYNGTYFVEVNSWNNSGYYDLVLMWMEPSLSDDDNLPDRAMPVSAGVYQSRIHQAMDHFDWYKIQAREDFRIQFDSQKNRDMFNLSIFKYDALNDRYVLIEGGWNVNFNLATREDEISNIIDIKIDLGDYGLGAGTYYFAVYAARATDLAYDPMTCRMFVYVTDGDAQADYELRIWTNSYDGWCGPKYLGPIPDVTVPEGTDLIDHVDLREHFRPKLGTPIEYRCNVFYGELESLVLNGDLLGFLAKDDFVGLVRVRVSALANTGLQYSTEWRIIFTPVNDAPRLKVEDLPLRVLMVEDIPSTFNLSELVMDIDEGDSLAVDLIPPEHLDLVINPDTLEVIVVGRPDWYGQEEVVFHVRDTENASVEIPVLFVVENVPEPPYQVRPIGFVVMDEDGTACIDLRGRFADPDGTDLTFAVDEDCFIAAEFDPETYSLILTPAPDWHGGRGLFLQVSDPEGHRLEVPMVVEVLSVPDPPVILEVSPSGHTVSLEEGGEVTFSMVDDRDVDSPTLTYTWYLDGRPTRHVPWFTYRPGVHDQGLHEVMLVVEDDARLTDAHTWMVNVLNVPIPPDGGIATPPDGGRFPEGRPVTFIALWVDPDSEDVSSRWYVDDSFVSDVPVFDAMLAPGVHRIRVDICDGEATITDEVTVTVLAGKEGTPWVQIALGVVAALATLGAALLVFHRHHREG